MSPLFELVRLISRVLAVYGALALVLTVLLLDFVDRSDVDTTPDALPRTAIVFTGQYDRIHLGIDLLTAGRVGQLFITGVNGPAGLDVARFVTQFGLSPEQATWLETGKIILAEEANSTFENAWETECWLRGQEDIDAVTLITERRHMPRASVALRNTIWPIRVERAYSDALKEYDLFQIDLKEFGAFIATWGVTILPYPFWPATEPVKCHTEPLANRISDSAVEQVA